MLPKIISTTLCPPPPRIHPPLLSLTPPPLLSFRCRMWTLCRPWSLGVCPQLSTVLLTPLCWVCMCVCSSATANQRSHTQLLTGYITPAHTYTVYAVHTYTYTLHLYIHNTNIRTRSTHMLRHPPEPNTQSRAKHAQHTQTSSRALHNTQQ